MHVIIKNNYDEISKEAAALIADRIINNPNLVLGLATGSTPLGLYKELIRMHRDEGLDFSGVRTFNLDEYIGLAPSHTQSYHYFMYDNFFKHVNIPEKSIHIPDGLAADIEKFCLQYEEEITRLGGIDLQILGIGSNGHIAFNEPGSSLSSRTRIKSLTAKTLHDNSRFFPSIDEMPRKAITMGIGTIMDAKELVLLANGYNKADAVKLAAEGPISTSCPASITQMHKKVTFIIDSQAGSKLSDIYNNS